jgi:hypothetical protein
MQMTISRLTALVLLTIAAAIPFRADAGTLRGSPSSMKQQHEIAVDEDLTFADEPAQIDNLVDSGALVSIEGNADFALSNVSFPYARPEVLLFIQRLSQQYHAENGAKLVVTSLTRPADLQPRNAHELSVHPAGMAVDFRVPSTAGQRAWLEKALLGLENARVLDVTREKHPPHYHVAVFPAEYLAYAGKKMSQEPVAVVKKDESIPAASSPVLTQAVTAVAPGVRAGSIRLIVALLLSFLLVIGAGPRVLSRISKD